MAERVAKSALPPCGFTGISNHIETHNAGSTTGYIE